MAYRVGLTIVLLVVNAAASTSAVAQTVCSVPQENAAVRDLDLYVTGLNHHGADCASGTREQDLQNLAGAIRRASDDPSRLVIAATGTNPIAGGGLYSDLNSCPANRLQHILEERYHASFEGRGASGPPNGCGVGTEYRIIVGTAWRVNNSAIEQFNEGGAPDSYLRASLTNRRTGLSLTVYVVRFSTGDADANAATRMRQIRKLLSRSRAASANSRVIIAGDFNSSYNSAEGGLLRGGGVRWLTSGLTCGNRNVFSSDEIMNAVVYPEPYGSDAHFKVVGAVMSQAAGLHVPEICHTVIALRFSAERCPEHQLTCGGVCCPSERCQDELRCLPVLPAGCVDCQACMRERNDCGRRTDAACVTRITTRMTEMGCGRH